MLELDGSYGEGGGQIVRAALFFSIALGKPFKVFNIRKGRKNPGLKRQHLNIIKTLLKISESKANGVKLGSLELEFYPGKVKGGKYVIDFKTAGSIPLYLQALLPILLFLEGSLHLEVKGGTDVPMGPTMDFTRFAFLPFVQDTGANVDIKVLKRGYYPEGGGVILLKAEKGSLNTSHLNLERGALERIDVYSVASKLLSKKRVAHRQLIAVERFVKEKLKEKIFGYFSYEDSSSPGSSITIVARFKEGGIISADSLGAPGKPSERVGKEAAEKFVAEFLSEGVVDVHLADHLVPLIALRGGSYVVSRITQHLETAVWVANRFMPGRLKIENNRIIAEGV